MKTSLHSLQIVFELYLLIIILGAFTKDEIDVSEKLQGKKWPQPLLNQEHS